MKAIDITIADDHIPKQQSARRKANITVFDDSEKQCITFYSEEGMQHTDHVFDPKDPKAVNGAAKALADFFDESVEDSMEFLNLFKQLDTCKIRSANQRPEDQCPVCDSEGMTVHKYHDGRCDRTDIFCEICGYEDEF